MFITFCIVSTFHFRTSSLTAARSRLFQGYAQELQAEINQELLETMHQTELDDWGRFGKVRQVEEKRLKDPADVLIQAEEYKRSQLRKKRTRVSKQKPRKAQNN
jgi:hypothetical protein